MALVMKSQTIISIVWFALLTWVNPASAQQTYSLSVGRHPSVQISDQKVDRILAAASKMLQKSSHHVDSPDDVACNVTFKRTGPIHTFASPNTPAVIKTESDRDAVHSENFDPSVINVKIIKEIDFCRPPQQGKFRGCSWPHQFRSIIVTADAIFPELVWPHEFGHHTGLWHRNGLDALMSPCPLQKTNVKVTQYECSCLLAGPGGCQAPEPQPPASCGP